MKDDLLLTLSFLSSQRSKLLSRTLDQHHDLYRFFFEYENDPDSLSLSFYKEEVFFINSHFECLDIFIDKPLALSLFQKAMKKLIFEFNEGVSVDSINSIHIARDIISEKIRLLDSLSDVDLKTKKNIEVLKYQLSRDNRLFERELTKLKG